MDMEKFLNDKEKELFLALYDQLADQINKIIAKEGPLEPRRYCGILNQYSKDYPTAARVLNSFVLVMEDDGRAKVTPAKGRGYLQMLIEETR